MDYKLACGWNWYAKLMVMIKHYFKTAWRNMLRNKMYAAINISGLALGLAAFWLIVLYIADELSYDTFNTKAERIVRVIQHSTWNSNEIHQATTSAPFAPALKAGFPEVEEAVRIDLEGGGILSWHDKKLKQGDIIIADKSFFNIFSFHFIHGSPAALNKPESVVITETLAKKIFGSADAAYQQTIQFDEHFPATVTGVIKDVPGNSHLRFSAVRAASDQYFPAGWQNNAFYTYLLLKPGTDLVALQKKLPAFAASTVQQESKIEQYSMELQPLLSIHLHSNLSFESGVNGNITRVYIFIVIALLILLIAIINYTNLTTARSSSRVKEIGVRKAIGSGKKNIAGMFITEAVLITCIAAAIAAAVVQLALPLFNQLIQKELSLGQLGIAKTVGSVVVFSILTGIISGIYPSLFLAGFKTIPALKSQMGNRTGNLVFRKSLVVFQFVITVLMIASSIVIYQQLHYARNTDLGFNKSQVLTFHIDDRAVRNQVPAIKNQLLKNPVIQGVAAAGNPIGNNDLGGMGYRFETNSGAFTNATTMSQELMIDADYLGTMDIQLLQGRNFSRDIPSDKYGAAMINETLMKKLGWQNAVGKRLQFEISDGSKLERTIVGVVKDFHTYSLQHAIDPLVLVMPPAASSEDNLYVKIAKGKTREGLAYIQQVYNQFDKDNQAVYNFLDQNFNNQYQAEERQGQIALIFSTLAIVIACLGLFGLATFTAAQRTKEIGIRKVLGASVINIVRMLSAEFLVLVVISTLVALPVAWIAMNKWLEGFAYRINVQWWVLALAGLLAMLIALLTVSFQAIKAAVANPVKSLRTE